MSKQEKILKEKVKLVRESVGPINNDNIILVLEYYNLNMDQAISAFLQDGAKEALEQWQSQSSVTKNKKKKNKKKTSNNQETTNLKQTENLKVNQKEAEIHMNKMLNQPETIPKKDNSSTNIIGQEEDIDKGLSTDLIEKEELDTFNKNTKEGNDMENLKPDKKTISKTKQDYKQMTKKSRERTLSELSGITFDSSLKNSSNKIDKSWKELQRQTASIGHLKVVLSEQMDKSYKRLKEVFKELRNQFNEREVELMFQLDNSKIKSYEILAMYDTRSSNLKMRTDRAQTMSDAELNTLRADIKQFVHDKKHYEEVATGSKFTCDFSSLLKNIQDFGQVAEIRSMSDYQASVDATFFSKSTYNTNCEISSQTKSSIAPASTVKNAPLAYKQSSAHILNQSESLTRYESQAVAHRLAELSSTQKFETKDLKPSREGYGSIGRGRGRVGMIPSTKNKANQLESKNRTSSNSNYDGNSKTSEVKSNLKSNDNNHKPLENISKSNDKDAQLIDNKFKSNDNSLKFHDKNVKSLDNNPKSQNNYQSLQTNEYKSNNNSDYKSKASYNPKSYNNKFNSQVKPPLKSIPVNNILENKSASNFNENPMSIFNNSKLCNNNNEAHDKTNLKIYNNNNKSEEIVKSGQKYEKETSSSGKKGEDIIKLNEITFTKNINNNLIKTNSNINNSNLNSFELNKNNKNIANTFNSHYNQNNISINYKNTNRNNNHYNKSNDNNSHDRNHYSKTNINNKNASNISSIKINNHAYLDDDMNDVIITNLIDNSKETINLGSSENHIDKKSPGSINNYEDRKDQYADIHQQKLSDNNDKDIKSCVATQSHADEKNHNSIEDYKVKTDLSSFKKLEEINDQIFQDQIKDKCLKNSSEDKVQILTKDYIALSDQKVLDDHIKNEMLSKDHSNVNEKSPAKSFIEVNHQSLIEYHTNEISHSEEAKNINGKCTTNEDIDRYKKSSDNESLLERAKVSFEKSVNENEVKSITKIHTNKQAFDSPRDPSNRHVESSTIDNINEMDTNSIDEHNHVIGKIAEMECLDDYKRELYSNGNIDVPNI